MRRYSITAKRWFIAIILVVCMLFNVAYANSDEIAVIEENVDPVDEGDIPDPVETDFIKYIEGDWNINRIDIDSDGNIYIIYDSKHCIKKISRDKSETIFGDGDTSSDADGKFNNPTDICIHEEDGTEYLYVSDTGNDRIQKLDLDGNFIEKIEHGFNSPTDIGLSNDNKLYILDSNYVNDGYVRVLDQSTNTWSDINNPIHQEDHKPIRLEVSKNGDFYIGFRSHSSSSYRTIAVYGGKDSIFYLSEQDNSIIHIGKEGWSYKRNKADNTADDTRLSYPRALAEDKYGNILVADGTKIKILDTIPPKITIEPNGSDEAKPTHKVRISISDGGYSGLPEFLGEDEGFRYRWKCPDQIDQPLTKTRGQVLKLDKDNREIEISSDDGNVTSGTCYIEVLIWDKAGNETPMLSNGFEFDIDREGPVVSFGEIDDLVKTKDTIITMSFTDDNAIDMSTLQYVLLKYKNADGSLTNSKPPKDLNDWSHLTGYTESTVNVSLDKLLKGNFMDLESSNGLEDGRYALLINIKDEFDNSSEIENSYVFMNIQLSYFPIKIQSTPSPESYMEKYDIKISTEGKATFIQWTDSEDQPEETDENWVAIDGLATQYESTSSWNIWTMKDVKKDSGIHYLHVKSIDKDGLPQYLWKKFLYDNEEAGINFIPDIQAHPEKSISIQVKATDNIPNATPELKGLWVKRPDLTADDINDSVDAIADYIKPDYWFEIKDGGTPDINGYAYSNELPEIDNNATHTLKISEDQGKNPPDGEYQFLAYVKDNGDHETFKLSSIFILDNTAPTGTVAIGAVNSVDKTVGMALTSTDNYSQRDNMYYQFSKDGTTWNGQWLPVKDGFKYPLPSNSIEQDITIYVKYKDEAGNESEVVSDTKTVTYEEGDIEAWIEYDHSLDTPTKDSVTAEIKWKGNAQIKNNGGSSLYTFIENGSFDFEISDSKNKIHTVRAQVYNIDREVLLPHISYSTTALTNESLILTLKPKEAVTITNSDITPSMDGDNYIYTIDNNGTYIFDVEDTIGNTASFDANIDYIDKTPPTIGVNISNEELTNHPVTVEIFEENGEEIMVLNNAGNLKRIFEENESFTFKVQDLAGNLVEKTVDIDNIDRTPPKGMITYSTEESTKDPVVATIKSADSDTINILNNRKNSTVEFKDNGSFSFYISDEAGNTAYVKASVSNIDKEPPNIVFNDRESLIFTKDEVISDSDFKDYVVTDNMSQKADIGVSIDKGSFETSTAGEYDITYTLIDEAGNSKEVVRKAIVIDQGAVRIFVNGMPLNEDNTVVTNKDSINLDVYNYQGAYTIKWYYGKLPQNQMKTKGNRIDGNSIPLVSVDKDQYNELHELYYDEFKEDFEKYFKDQYTFKYKGWVTIYLQDQERNTKLIYVYVL
jgi:hypothetical protein